MKLNHIKKLILTIALITAITVIGFGIYLSSLKAKNETACIPIQQPSQLEITAELASQFQSILENYSAAHNNVGLQATVIFPNNKQWSGTAGYGQDQKACPLTLQHHLYIGSVTKALTASLVMKQVESGLIQLNDTIVPWINHPEAENISIEMLLQHTSGLPNYTEDVAFIAKYFGRPQKVWQPEELFAIIQEKPLNFKPGSQHLYSNSNFIALGIILEKITGNTYGQILQSTAEEMGLEHIYYPVYTRSIRLANGYDETIFNLGKRDLTAFRTSLESGAFSAGGIAGTSQDIATYFHKLFNGSYLSDHTVQQMITTIDAPDEDVPLQQGYGLGIRNILIDEQMLYGHTGTIPGYSAIALHNPNYNYTIVVLSNVSTIEQTNIYAQLQKIILQPN